MPPSLTRHFSLLITAIIIVGSSSSNAGAETKLTDFVGAWHGKGTDRNLPLDPFQKTNCRMWVRVDQRHLNSSTVCHGPSGHSKVIRQALTLSGDRFTGRVSQTNTARGRTAIVRGSLSGVKTADGATYRVRFADLTPNAEVALKRVGPSSFSMLMTVHGFTMMDLIFNRPDAD